jgi:outer membrane protein assembly factor BamB/tetratricopeptide (TPR) repeat protein
MCRISLTLILALFLAGPLCAQPETPKGPAPIEEPRPAKGGTIPGEEQRTRDDLNSAAKLADSKRYDEAIRRYQQILAEAGDLLVPVDANRSLPARWIVHQRLAVLPPEARKLYRDKVDDSTRKWLEQGIAQRDEKLLDQVVSEAFCSTPAEQALQLLGDMALERGEFESAQRWWRLLSPPASKVKNPPKHVASFELVYPDAKDKGALAQAKQILALVLQGAKEPAVAELKAFRELHPSVEGFLAGSKGKYTEILQSLIDGNERWNPAAAPGASTWLTFAGDASRNYRLANANSPYWPDSPMWQIDLPGDPNAKPHREADPPPGTGASSRALAFHPVIIPGFVLVADALRVTAYHLATGKQAAQYDQRRDADNRNAVPESIDLRLPSHTDARYTLTVAGNRLYVRLGATRMKEPEDNTKPAESDNWIVCLGLERDGDNLKLQYRWQIRARLLDADPVALFEGTPVVQDGRLLVPRTRFDGRQVITSIDCYDADAPNGRKEPPPLRWTRDVWIMESGKASEAVRHRTDLVTMAGPFVVYCTHSGLIIALDAAGGKRMWAFRYPTAASKPFDGILPRDLCPCIYANGRIYAAPADSDRIFCLDATTGENIWESSPANVVHLLGISRGKLLATLGGYPQGLRGYDANSGDPIWTKPDEGDRAPHGRGFLSDDFVFWPTRRGLKVLRQDDGEPQDAGSSGEPFGNIAFGEGCMIVATPTELWGFIPERMRLNFRQREVQERPDDALAHYKLGLALADAGKEEKAWWSFRQAAEKARPEDCHHCRLLKDLALHRNYELALGLFMPFINRPEPILNGITNVLDDQFSIEDRVRAQNIVNLYYPTEHLLFKRMTRDEPVRRGELSPPPTDAPALAWVTSDDGLPIRFDELLISSGSRIARSAMASQVARCSYRSRTRWLFPWLESVRREYLALASECEQRQDYGTAAMYYRRLLFPANCDEGAKTAAEERGATLSDLIRIYEKMGQFDAAKKLQHLLQQEGFKTARIQRDEISPHNGRPAIDILPPLKAEKLSDLRAFHEFPLQGLMDSKTDSLTPAVVDGGVFFLTRDQEIVCHELGRGSPYWTKDLHHDAESFTVHADVVIVTGRQGISSLGRTNGSLNWEVMAPEPQPMPGKTRRPLFRTIAEPALPKPFSAFRLAGTRLFMLHGGQKLLGLDVEAGRFLWQRWAPGAPICDPDEGAGFTENYIATDDVILLQTTAGRYIGVDAVNGKVLYQQKQNSALWTSPPVLLDSQRAVFPLDAEHIACIELANGKILWQQPIAGWSSLAGPAPQLRRDGSHLVLIVERNFGYEIERWELETGKRDLPPVFLGRERVALASIGITSEGYVIPASKSARCFSRDDGKRLWEMPLPNSSGRAWHVQAIRGAVLVYPEEALPEPAGRFPYPWPGTYHVFMRRQFPLFVVDSKSGKVLQEFKTPVQGPRATLLLGKTQAAIAVEGSIWRLKEAK